MLPGSTGSSAAIACEGVRCVLPPKGMSSENELCEAYNVSRVTVRKAIDLLVQEGYVYTIKGKGTYVKGKYIEQPLTHFYSFREDLRSRGVSTYSTMPLAL